MLTFHQFLNEAKNTLYHGTSEHGAKQILKHNSLHTAADHIAWTTNNRKEAEWYARQHGRSGRVIHFNGDTLKNHPKVKHFDEAGAAFLKDKAKPGLNNIKDHITRITHAQKVVRTGKQKAIHDKVKFHTQELKKLPNSMKHYKSLSPKEQKRIDKASDYHQKKIEHYQSKLHESRELQEGKLKKYLRAATVAGAMFDGAGTAHFAHMHHAQTHYDQHHDEPHNDPKIGSWNHSDKFDKARYAFRELDKGLDREGLTPGTSKESQALRDKYLDGLHKRRLVHFDDNTGKLYDKIDAKSREGKADSYSRLRKIMRKASSTRKWKDMPKITMMPHKAQPYVIATQMGRTAPSKTHK